MSPPYHYLAEVAGPAFRRMGARFGLELARWGWTSEGGGEVRMKIEPVQRLEAADFRPEPKREVRGLAGVTNLPSHIPHRMARRAHNLLAERGLAPNVQAVRENGAGPGAGIVLWKGGAGASSLGARGLPADKVAEAAVAELLAFVDNGAAVDHHLADQLLIPMALAHGRSSLTTNRLTLHTLTNADLLRRWLDVTVNITGGLNEPGEIAVEGAGWSREQVQDRAVH
jgi:RNA 3'-terminal phosphate cyclase (ATP)